MPAGSSCLSRCIGCQSRKATISSVFPGNCDPWLSQTATWRCPSRSRVPQSLLNGKEFCGSYHLLEGSFHSGRQLAVGKFKMSSMPISSPLISRDWSVTYYASLDFQMVPPPTPAVGQTKPISVGSPSSTQTKTNPLDFSPSLPLRPLNLHWAIPNPLDFRHSLKVEPILPLPLVGLVSDPLQPRGQLLKNILVLQSSCSHKKRAYMFSWEEFTDELIEAVA
jgi:hypothetical protein